MAPALVLLCVFVIVPVGYAIYIAFTNTRLTGREAIDRQWVGLANFRRLIDSGDLQNSARLTLIFVVGSALIGQNLLGLCLALLMARRRWAVRVAVSSVVLACYVFPEIVPGFMWSSFLSPHGALNSLLGVVHLPATQILIDHPMLGVILADIWRATAFSMLVYSAALADIDSALLEAARVDGASYLRTLWHIQLPLLRRTAFTNLMLITLPTLSVFTMTRVDRRWPRPPQRDPADADVQHCVQASGPGVRDGDLSHHPRHRRAALADLRARPAPGTTMTGATRSPVGPIAANLALTAIALAFIGPMLWMLRRRSTRRRSLN